MTYFELTDEDALRLFVCDSQIGSTNVDFQSTHLINIKKTWDKLYLAARVIASIKNPADVCVVSARSYAQRALLKFAAHTGATPIFGRFTPGSLTNQIQKNFKEPRLLIVSDPRIDHQAVTEASFVNIPVISFCNTDSPLKFIDISIPCNNKGQKSVGLLWWLLAREVLILRGKITRQMGFILDDKTIMPDLYFYRDPQDQEKEEQIEVLEDRKDPWSTQIDSAKTDEFQISASEPAKLDFQVPHIDDWAAASTWDQTITDQSSQQQVSMQQQAQQPNTDWIPGVTNNWC